MINIFNNLFIFAQQCQGICHPFPDVQANNFTVSSILHFVFGLAGAIAFLMLVIGGFKYIISGGESQAVKEAKETMIYAAVGLAVAVSAYGIVSLVLKYLA